jgi:threonine/homoserine/homoserine lactone efflux protein
MDATAALLAGLVAGLAIAMQVGAVSLLLVEASIVAGPRAGVAAGMGVATADLAFAVVAAAAGGAAGAALASHETEIRVVAALVLAAIAVHGLWRLARSRSSGGESDEAERPRPGEAVAADAARTAATGRADDPRTAATGRADHSRTAATGRADDPRAAAPPRAAARAHFARFLAITAANPLTIASFAAVAASLSLHGAVAAAAFAAGVGLASAAWHLVLSLAAGHAGRWITLRVRHGLAIGGRVAVLGIAAHLALAV